MDIQNDGVLTISTGKSRKTKHWQKKNIAWSVMLDKLSTPKRTCETQAQYAAMSKEQRAVIKDVGGFVGGELRDGLRKSTNVISRQLVTLDADFADAYFWSKVTDVFGNAACVYSTHSYTAENPRMRLIMPLDRPVKSDEYQAIAHKIAEKVGIEYFDDTTYQPQRLMYYPSTSKDGNYTFNWQDGKFVSADELLNEYEDWRDVSSWAYSSRSKEVLGRDLSKAKAQDPAEKVGIIGAFCRTYGISEVIEKFLSDVYEECGENRYTYIAGSTTGGAVAYENKWLYSYHNTDPASLQLCNAFDLVRIHKFGDADINSKQTDTNKLPSYKAMNDFCMADADTKAKYVAESLNQAKDDFDAAAEAWKSQFELTKTGKLENSYTNIRLVFENDPGIKNKVGYDEFSHKLVIIGELPWSNTRGETPSEYWEDSDDSALRSYFGTEYKLVKPEIIRDELTNSAKANRFHCVRNYLRGLKWDGVERIDTFFIDYLGAADTRYTRTITRKSLIAGVGRVMQPGIKFDSMIVLVGKPGRGKSTLIEKLGKKWFTRSIKNMNDKDALVGLQGFWIVEFDELDAVKRSELTAVKSFISGTTDNFREPYGKHVVSMPRQCIFFGTTNEKNFLKDPTGNRRFLPIQIDMIEPRKLIFTDTVDDEIDQIWAEAYAAWNNHETLWHGTEMEQIAAKIQNRYAEEIAWLGTIERYLDIPIPANWYELNVARRINYINDGNDFDSEEEVKLIRRDKVCAVEIWCEALGGEMRRLTPFDSNKITTVLEKLGNWTPYIMDDGRLQFGSSYGYQKAYIRKVDEDDI